MTDAGCGSPEEGARGAHLLCDVKVRRTAMARSIVYVVALGLVGLATAGCADKRITVRYEPATAMDTLTGAVPITIVQFADRRGSEGDQDPYRVGGVYGGYGNRLSKIITDTSWQRTVVRALAAGFRARGVETATADDQEYKQGSAFATPLALGGEIRNFSTESRWSTSAHISGIVRLYDVKGTVLVEKTISERETWGIGAGVLMAAEPLEATLNKALEGFVRKVATDPELSAQLTRRR